MATKFAAREFMYADQLTEFVQLAAGAVVPFSVTINGSGHFVMFSNDDEEALAKIKADAAIASQFDLFVDRGRGRGLEQVTVDEKTADDARAAEDAATLAASIAKSAKVIAAATRRQELQAQADAQIAEVLAKEGLA